MKVTFLHIEECQPVEGYILNIEFNTGERMEVDLSNELKGPVFEPLRDPVLFSKVKVSQETGTIEWPNGADFAPEFLHSIGRVI